MTLASQNITVLDPGLGLVNVAADAPVVTGACSGGATGTLYSFSSLNSVKSTLGMGDLAEVVAKNLVERGGPILAVKSAASTAATSSSVTKTGTGTPTPTISGTPTFRTQTRVRVKVGGALGVAQFDYAHDNFQPANVAPTWSTQRVIPSGGTYAFPLLGVTMTFPAGTYVAGDTFDFTTEPAHSNASDVTTLGSFLLTQPGLNFRTWTVAESCTTATEGFALAVALGSALQLFATNYGYARGICDVGSADTSTNVKTAKASFSDRRVAPCYGYEIVSSPLAFEGYSNRLASCSGSISARANRVVASSALDRYAEGSLNGTQYIYFDSNADSTVDAVGINTLRTWPRAAGFYIANSYLAAPTGSDFTFWQLGRLMDLGCSAVYGAMQQFIADDLRTLAGGTLDPKDAAIVNTAGLNALTQALMRPKNARGRAGLVSAVSFLADLTNDVLDTEILQTTTGIRPRGYTRTINQTIGFTDQ